MSVIDLHGAVVDDWVRYDRFKCLGAAQRVLVGSADLAKYPRYFECARLRLAIDLDPGESIESIAGWLPRLDLVVLNFTAFADGRAFSQARLLRERFDFRGDIRAQGQVVRDQLAFMQRCGINQFVLQQGEPVESALAALSGLSVSYQPDPRERTRTGCRTVRKVRAGAPG